MPIARSSVSNIYAPAALPSSFSSTLSNAENPAALGGVLLQGAANGSNWQNTQCSGGKGYGTGTSAVGAFNDNVCCLNPALFSITPNKHYAQHTVWISPGYAPVVDHEFEILVGFNISFGVAKGYEMSWQMGQGGQPVRWDGALGAFDASVFTTLSGAPFGISNGDVVKVTFDSTSGSPVITLNNITQSLTHVVTDTTAGKILTGMPGWGDFAHPDATIDLTKYGTQAFSAASA